MAEIDDLTDILAAALQDVPKTDQRNDLIGRTTQRFLLPDARHGLCNRVEYSHLALAVDRNHSLVSVLQHCLQFVASVDFDPAGVNDALCSSRPAVSTPRPISAGRRATHGARDFSCNSAAEENLSAIAYRLFHETRRILFRGKIVAD